MRAYADTSFLVKLLTAEPDSPAAMAGFRRLGYPRLFFLSLHALEVNNAVRQRAFQRQRSDGRGHRAAGASEREATLARVEQWRERGWLIEATTDCEEALRRARSLSDRHTERLGCRAFDLLHVALALELECEAFLTADRVQATLARAEGLSVTVV